VSYYQPNCLGKYQVQPSWVTGDAELLTCDNRLFNISVQEPYATGSRHRTVSGGRRIVNMLKYLQGGEHYLV